MTYPLHHILYWLRLILAIVLLVVTYYFNNLTGGWKGFENIFYYFFAVLGTVSLALTESLFSRRKVYGITTLDIFLTLFVSYVALRTTLTNAAFWENESFLVLATLYATYFVCKQLFADARSVVVFLVCMTLLGLLTSGHGILQKIGVVESNSSMFDITGPFVNPQIYGGYLAALLPFVVALSYFSRNSSYQRFFVWLNWGVVLFLLVALVLAQSRAAWLACLASIGFLLQSHYHWFERAKNFLTQTRIRVGLLMVISLLLGLLFFLKLDSAAGRLLIWRISLPMGWDNFLLGVGYGQFKIHYLDYQATFFASHPGLAYAEKIAGMTYYAFNEFLQIALELGVIGFLLYLRLLFVAFVQNHTRRSVSKKDKNIRTLAQSTLVNILVFSLFSYPFSILPIHLLFFVSLALVSSTMHQYTFVMNVGTRLGLTIAIVTCCFLGKVQWERYRATEQWKQAAFAFSFY